MGFRLFIEITSAIRKFPTLKEEVILIYKRFQNADMPIKFGLDHLDKSGGLNLLDLQLRITAQSSIHTDF